VVNRRCGGQFPLRLEAGAGLLFSAGDSLQSVVSRMLTCFKTRALYMVCYFYAIIGADSGRADHARVRGPPMDTSSCHSVSPCLRWRYAYGAGIVCIFRFLFIFKCLFHEPCNSARALRFQNLYTAAALFLSGVATASTTVLPRSEATFE
jgi:hypothetical protein